MKNISQIELDSQIRQFTGTENWYKHQFTGFLFTDGVKYCGDNFGIYWFIDIVFFANKPKLLDEFQVWKLTKNLEDDSCTIIADNGDEDENGLKKVLYYQRIPFTDFPAESITLFFTNTVLLLPSEN